MLFDIENIILEYANIKREDDEYINYCNLCKKHKLLDMKCMDIEFYEIKISFIFDTLFDSFYIKNYSNFQSLILNSDIEECENYNRLIWITNSLYIEEFWEEEKNTEENTISNRIKYREFLDKNFIYLERRAINICDKCENKKIKLD